MSKWRTESQGYKLRLQGVGRNKAELTENQKYAALLNNTIGVQKIII